MPEDKEVKEGKIYGVIAYLWILCLIPLLLKKENKFALFHGKQGLVLFIFEIALWVISVIPIIGWAVGFLGTILCAIMSLAGIIQALMGNYWKMPLLGDYAEKISL